jgi:hypothetical protein
VTSILRDEAPPAKQRREYAFPYDLFRRMQVGDSFIIAPEQALQVERSAWRFRQDFDPWCFEVGVDSSGNSRLWRIEDKPKWKKRAPRTLESTLESTLEYKV